MHAEKILVCINSVSALLGLWDNDEVNYSLVLL